MLGDCCQGNDESLSPLASQMSYIYVDFQKDKAFWFFVFPPLLPAGEYKTEGNEHTDKASSSNKGSLDYMQCGSNKGE